MPVKQTNLLKTIKSYCGTNLLYTYTLTHQLKNVNLLTKIDCKAGTSELNPLVFNYGTGMNYGFFQTATSSYLASYFANSNPSGLILQKTKFNAQNNNDGLISYPNLQPYGVTATSGTNYQYGSRYPTNQDLLIYKNLNSGNSTAVKIQTGSGFQKLTAVDINGDGNDELVKVNYYSDGTSGKLQVTTYSSDMIATSQTFTLTNVIQEGTLKSPAPFIFVFGDFNGDGKVDLAAVQGCKNPKGGSIVYSSTVYVFSLDTKVKLFQYTICAVDIFKDVVFAADMNGDGKSDLCVSTSSVLNVYSHYDNTFKLAMTDYLLRPSDIENREMLLTDINGDGKTDILLSPLKDRFKLETKVHLSNCQGACTGSPTTTSADGSILIYIKGNNSCQVYRDPQKTYLSDAYQWRLYTSTGKSLIFTYPTIRVSYDTGTKFLIADVNGDKLPDLAVFKTGKISAVFNENGTLSSRMDSSSASVEADSYFIPGDLEVGMYHRSSQLLAIKNATVTPIYFTKNDGMESLITSVVNSHGARSEYMYDNFADCGLTDGKTYGGYPYAQVKPALYVVSSEKAYLGNTLVNSLSYTYYNAIMHRQKNSFAGFGKINVRNNITTHTVNSEYDPTCFGMCTLTETPVKKDFMQYKVDYSSNKIAKLYMTSSREEDKLTSIYSNTTYQYDAYGNLTMEEKSWLYDIWARTRYTYYNNKNTSKYILGVPTSKSVERWNNEGSIATVKDTWTVNSSGLPSKLKQTYDNTNVSLEEDYTYDSYGNLTKKTEKPFSSATLLTTQYEYDVYGRITKESGPISGIYTTTTYNTAGLPETIKNHKNQTTRYTYDVWGKLIQTDFPDGTVDKISYVWSTTPEDGLYNTTSTSTGKPTNKQYYDALGREIKTSTVRYDGTELKTNTEYNNKGLVSRVSLAYKGTSPTLWNSYTYDTYNRITKLTYASGKTDTYSYNLSTTTAVSDGISTKKTYNPFGNVTSVVDPAGTISYKYRLDGQVLKITAPGGHETNFGYDVFGRRTYIEDATSGRTTYSYDVAGNLSQEKTAANRITTMTYDSYYRLKTNAVSGMFTTTYAYNTDNQLLSETSTNNTIAYTYDTYGRLSTEKETAIDSKWLKKTFGYSSGNISSVAYESQSGSIGTENFSYQNGNLTEIKLGTTSVWKKTAENAMGHTSSAITGPLTRTYTYNSYGYLTNRTVKKGTAVIQNFNYSFDPLKQNLTSRKDNVRNLQENFTYDNLNRLKTFSGKTMEYDVKGNITKHQNVASYSYHSTVKPYAVNSITLLGASLPHRAQSVSYNAMNRPATITENSYTASFTYGNSSQRVKMQLKQGTTVQLTRYYLNNYEIDEGTAGNKERLYIGGDAYSASAVYVKENGTWALNYICRDYLGSITHVTNSTGTLRQELSYDAWGRLRNPVNHSLYTAGSESTPLLGRGYTGHEHLTQFGLINMNARLYDSGLGRFLNPDPYVQDASFSQNFNRYSYCYNNPLKYTDPSGEWILIDDAIAALIGGSFNLFSNLFQGNITSFWHGAASFGVGAASGWSTLYAGPVGAGVLLGAGNSVINQGFTNGWGNINYMQVGTSAIMGGATSYLGGQVGKFFAKPLAGFTQGIKSDVLRNMLTQSGINGATGFTLGTGISLLNGESFGNALNNGTELGLWGMTTGAVSGSITGFRMAHQNQRNPWTRRSYINQKVQDTATSFGIYSSQTGVNPEIVDEYYKQMANGTFDPQKSRINVYMDDQRWVINDGNHRMNAAIKYYLNTNNDYYIKTLFDNAHIDKSIFTSPIYKLPVP